MTEADFKMMIPLTVIDLNFGFANPSQRKLSSQHPLIL